LSSECGRCTRATKIRLWVTTFRPIGYGLQLTSVSSKKQPDARCTSRIIPLFVVRGSVPERVIDPAAILFRGVRKSVEILFDIDRLQDQASVPNCLAGPTHRDSPRASAFCIGAPTFIFSDPGNRLLHSPAPFLPPGSDHALPHRSSIQPRFLESSSISAL
jgi:hypothetical protein